MHTEAVDDYARRHGAGLWQCLCAELGIDLGQEDTVKETATLSMHVSCKKRSSE